MYNKASNDRFLLVSFGCCIPTESYAWIAVVLFMFSIAVLIFCIFATAVVKWMYKRRMRKRLQQVKDKLTQELKTLRENEEKLAMKKQDRGYLRGAPSAQVFRDDDVVIQPISIFIDTTKNYNRGKGPLVVQKITEGTDNDPTPIAQSTLADTVQKSFTSVDQVPNNQQEVVVEMPEPSNDQRQMKPTGHQISKKPSIPNDAVMINNKPGKDGQLNRTVKFENGESTNDGPTSLDMLRTPTPVSGLQPPTTVTTTTNPSKTTNASSGTDFLIKHNNHTFSSQSSELSPDAPIKMDTVPSSNSNRPGAAGDPSYSSYKTTASVFSSHGRSWLVDSTGTDRQSSSESQDSSSVSKTNSFFKTDTSSYKTATIKSYSHGAFVFEK